MIEVGKLSIGDTVFMVNETNNAFTKKKITMTDANGVEWFRYDRNHWNYTISELKYCGRVDYQIQGEVRDDELRMTEFHFKHPDGQIYPEYQEDIGEYEFWTREEAEAYIEVMKAKRSEYT